MSIEILDNMGHDTLAVLLNTPGVTVTSATVENINRGLCEAVVEFSDGSTLTGTFELPDDDPAFPKLVRAVEGLLLDAVLKVEASIARDVPSLGHSVH